jgi:hypothetical protein
MSAGLILACVWALVATGCAMLPHRWHWPAAYALIAAGIPILGLVTWQEGPVWGFLVMAGGVSVLRWPFRRAGLWLRGRLRRG